MGKARSRWKEGKVSEGERADKRKTSRSEVALGRKRGEDEKSVKKKKWSGILQQRGHEELLHPQGCRCMSQGGDAQAH